MSLRYAPFLFAIVVANPVFNVLIPQSLEHPLLESALGRHLKTLALLSQNYRNLQQPLVLPKNLLALHLKLPNSGLQMKEGITNQHLASLGFESSSIQDPISASYPILANIKELEYPQKINEVSKASNFPLNIGYSSNSLGFQPIEQFGGLQSAFSAIPASYSGGGFNNVQSISYGY